MNFYELIDVLIVDDIQFFAKKTPNAGHFLSYL